MLAFGAVAVVGSRVVLSPSCVSVMVSLGMQGPGTFLLLFGKRTPLLREILSSSKARGSLFLSSGASVSSLIWRFEKVSFASPSKYLPGSWQCALLSTRSCSPPWRGAAGDRNFPGELAFTACCKSIDSDSPGAARSLRGQSTPE